MDWVRQTYSRRTADVQQTYSRRTADVQQTYSRRTADVQQTYSRRTADIQQTSASVPSFPLTCTLWKTIFSSLVKLKSARMAIEGVEPGLVDIPLSSCVYELASFLVFSRKHNAHARKKILSCTLHLQGKAWERGYNIT